MSWFESTPHSSCLNRLMRTLRSSLLGMGSFGLHMWITGTFPWPRSKTVRAAPNDTQSLSEYMRSITFSRASAEFSLASARMFVQGFPLPLPLGLPRTGCIGRLLRIRVGSFIAPEAMPLRLVWRAASSPAVLCTFVFSTGFKYLKRHNAIGYM